MFVRAEILYRCSIPPFDRARDVLSKLLPSEAKTESEHTSTSKDEIKTKKNLYDILQLCNMIPNEVLGLPTGGGVRNTIPS